MYNSADGTVQKISRDQVGGYDMEKLEELQNTEDAPTDVGQLHWIINPTPSEDNTLVAYQSNRRTYEDFVRRYREDGEKEGFRIGLYLKTTSGILIWRPGKSPYLSRMPRPLCGQAAP